MNDTHTADTVDAEFGEVIHCYSRAQALEDGVLIEVTQSAKAAGFCWPVALTRAAWEDCVAWTDQDNRHQTYQDESGRLWDVLWMAAWAIRQDRAPVRSEAGTELKFSLQRVPRDGTRTKARLTTLKLIAGPGDNGEPVITILMPNED